MEEEDEVNLFKEILRFRTISLQAISSGEYARCVEFLERKSKELVAIAETQVVEAVEKKPVLVVKIPGDDPSLDAVVLNSHYDVVPCMMEHWDVDPWQAVEKDGKIFGRGTQDMKCVCAQYLLSLGRLFRKKKETFAASGQEVKTLFKRNLFLTFVPDEEIGGKDGMGAFIKKGHFQKIIGKCGIALDEGLANPGDGEYTVFYGERMPMWILVKCEGPTGHGSRFIKDTAIEKLINLANKAFELRKEQEQLLGYGEHQRSEQANGCKHCEAKKLGDVLTINLTALRAGVTSDDGKEFSLNVIPTTAVAGFDIRVPVTTPVKDIRAMLDEWCKDEGMSWKFDPKTGHDDDRHAVSSISEDDKWWKAFSDVCKESKVDIQPEIFPAGTDSRFLRQAGIPAFGFSPMTRSPILLHEHNEYLERKVFLDGIDIYDKIIPKLANLP